MKLTIRFILKILGTISSSLLIFSSVAMHVNPGIFPLAGFASLLFVPLIAINLFFLIFFLIRIGKVSAFISGFALLTATLILPRLWQPPIHSSTNRESVKLMSYNVRLFDLYNWRGNNSSRDSIFSFFKSERPEVLCFQEFYWDQSNEFATRDSLTQLLGMPYVSEYYTSRVLKTYYFGIASFSKYPIIHDDVIIFDKTSNLCLVSDVVLPWDTVRIFNCHLESLRFIDTDYKAVTGENGIMNSFLQFPIIYKKVSKAFKLRAQQAIRITELAKESPHPVIVLGDFNDSPLSFVYQYIKSTLELTDSFKESGSGFGGTYNGNLPSYRIDYILHSAQIKSTNFTVYPVKYSDHFPISAQIFPTE